MNRSKNSSGQADIMTYNDYFPFGSIVQSGGTNYCYDYRGAYSEKDAVTGWNNFLLRMYDAKIGRWLTTDPKGKFVSPYLGMGNKPIIGFDPTGGLIPIYDQDTGELLGTNDQGLQGPAVLMAKSKFKQNMSHEDALNIGTTLSNVWNDIDPRVSKIQISYAGLPNRPDYVGFITKQGAFDWYHDLGKGRPLYATRGLMDLYPVTEANFANAPINKNSRPQIGYNFFFGESNTNTKNVFGGVMLTLLNPNTGEVRVGGPNKIDTFDLNPDGSFIHAMGNVYANWLLDSGQQFDIIGYGSNPHIPVK